MSGFVIEYNRITGERVVLEFPGSEGHREALLRRLKLERERSSLDWEIVSLNSDSIETVQKTHSRYFTGHNVSSLSA